jgi:hypothetical protein
LHFSIIFTLLSAICKPILILSLFLIYVLLHSSSFQNFRSQWGEGGGR